MKQKITPLALVMAVILLLTGCIGYGSGRSGRDENPDGPPTFQSQPGDDRIVGNFEVEINSVVVATTENGRENYLIARIVFTNNSSENTTFKSNLAVAMFQDGVLLSSKTPRLNGFDFDSTGKIIRPGASLEVELAFTPENLVSLVEVEVYIKDNYYVDSKAAEKVRADFYGATMELGGGQISNTADTIAVERQAIIDEWEAEQARLAEEAASTSGT